MENIKNKSRWVWGTRSLRWHSIGPDDRDYCRGIPDARFRELTGGIFDKQYPELEKAFWEATNENPHKLQYVHNQISKLIKELKP